MQGPGGRRSHLSGDPTAAETQKVGEPGMSSGVDVSKVEKAENKYTSACICLPPSHSQGPLSPDVYN